MDQSRVSRRGFVAASLSLPLLAGMRTPAFAGAAEGAGTGPATPDRLAVPPSPGAASVTKPACTAPPQILAGACVMAEVSARSSVRTPHVSQLLGGQARVRV